MILKYIKKDEIILKIEAEKNFFTAFDKFKHYEILDVKENFKIEKVPTIFMIKGYDSPFIEWDEQSEKLSFCYRKLDNSVFNAIDHLINSIILREYEKRNVYMLHSSSVYIPKSNSIELFFGGSGAGKTTLMLELVRKYHCKYISNGATLVKLLNSGNFKVLGSYKKGIKLRASSLSMYDKTLYSNYFNELSSMNKVETDPEDLNLNPYQQHSDSDVNLSLFFIKICQSPLNVNRKINYRISMLLLKDISRHLKFSELYLEVNDIPIFIPSIDNEELFSKRVFFVNKILETCFQGYIHGEFEDMVKYVNEERVII